MTHGAVETPSQTVEVSEQAGEKQGQATVTVSLVQGSLIPSPASVVVKRGDLVIWTAAKGVSGGFRIRGTSGGQVVDSGSLETESIFTHAFGQPGLVRWVDVNGSGVQGDISVLKPEGSDTESWLNRLADGTLIHVRGRDVSASDVSIVVGQTIVWAIEDAPGITITDATLIQRRTD